MIDFTEYWQDRDESGPIENLPPTGRPHEQTGSGVMLSNGQIVAIAVLVVFLSALVRGWTPQNRTRV